MSHVKQIMKQRQFVILTRDPRRVTLIVEEQHAQRLAPRRKELGAARITRIASMASKYSKYGKYGEYSRYDK